jgi:hypothetical protein
MSSSGDRGPAAAIGEFPLHLLNLGHDALPTPFREAVKEDIGDGFLLIDAQLIQGLDQFAER